MNVGRGHDGEINFCIHCFFRNAEVSMAHEWEGERGGDSKNKRKKAMLGTLSLFLFHARIHPFILGAVMKRGGEYIFP